MCDNSLEELNQIGHLLYGFNYEVFLRLYGPSDPNLGLTEALRGLISGECELSRVLQSSPKLATSIITNCLLHKGDEGAGPLELDLKKAEVIKLISNVFSSIEIENAEMVIEFGFKHGHPAYPVFWDFAFDIHVKDKRWILVGSSSD